MMGAKTSTRRRTVMQRCVMTKRAAPGTQLGARRPPHRVRQMVLPEEVKEKAQRPVNQRELEAERVLSLHEPHSDGARPSVPPPL